MTDRTKTNTSGLYMYCTVELQSPCEHLCWIEYYRQRYCYFIQSLLHTTTELIIVILGVIAVHGSVFGLEREKKNQCTSIRRDNKAKARFKFCEWLHEDEVRHLNCPILCPCRCLSIHDLVEHGEEFQGFQS